MANKLINATSLYLQQHAHNPVNWYSWGSEPFEIATIENKPVLVSIGYAACHWCHVMEKESFEDVHVANYMNQHFINIKVDREEHPDVDHFFMDALIAMQQSGGWPLNMFVTPEGKPFYGGTYFPPKNVYHKISWMQTLEAVNATWKLKKEEVLLQANQLIQHLAQLTNIEKPINNFFDTDFIINVCSNLNRYSDDAYGGFSNAPKFPSFGCIQILLETGFYKNDTTLINKGIFHLNQLLKGGIYDQIGGGIARYATDNEWLIPHFEKMLYDNAQLISLLSKAYQINGSSYHKDKLIETIDFVITELSYGGAFASSLDADSDGEEGKYYVWKYNELTKLNLHPSILDFWDITEAGNWENHIILHESADISTICNAYNLSQKDWEQIYLESKQKLLALRKLRASPSLDNKIITSLNAMLSIAFMDAYRAVKDDKYLNFAAQIIHHIINNCFDEKQLLHQDISQNSIPAKLDDYAWLIKALLMLLQHTNDTKYYNLCIELLQYAIENFSDEEQRFFYYSDKQQQDILVRKIELYDGAQPSSNALMVENLMILGNLNGNYEWIERAEHMALSIHKQAMQYPTSFSHWIINTQYIINGWKINIVLGEKSFAMIKEMLFIFMPNLYSLDAKSFPKGSREFDKFEKNDECVAFICEKGICNLPTKDIFKIFK